MDGDIALIRKMFDKISHAKNPLKITFAHEIL